MIEGAKLATKEEAAKSGQPGPYAGSQREKIAKELLEFAQQQINSNHPEVKRDDSINLVVRQDVSGEVPLTVSTRDVTEFSFD